MDLDFIMKVAGIAMIVGISSQIMSRIGKDDHSNLVSVAGIIAILVILFEQIASLFDTVKDLFGI